MNLRILKSVAVLNLVAALVLAVMFFAPREEVGAQAIDVAATAIQVVGAASPGLSVTDRANIYYDTTADTLQLSVNGGAYATLAAGGVTGSGANTQVTYWTGASTVAGDAGMTYDATGDDLTLAGHLIVGAGAVSVPSIRSSVDADTGFSFTATPAIGINVDSANIAFVDSNGITTNTATARFIGNGGDAATAPNFQVDIGEGLYDCGANNCVGIAQNGSTNPLAFFADDSHSQLKIADAIVFSATSAAAGTQFTRMTSGDSLVTINDSTSVFSVNIDAASRWGLDTNGHVFSDAVAVNATVTTGTCTNETLTSDSNDMRGEVEADCTAGQTIIVTFGTAYGTTPFCVVSASNAAGGASVAAGTASTTALTITVVGVITDGRFAWMCLQ